MIGRELAGKQGSKHLKLEKPTPAANLFLTMSGTAGIQLDSFADSTTAYSHALTPQSPSTSEPNDPPSATPKPAPST